MRILLTNDDGFDAEGLQEIARALSDEHDCYIVAPDRGRSCCSHSVTNHELLSLRNRGEQRWELSGTPADCVRVAILHLELQPDWVISGINHGGNLGIDTLYSGTVAAAREAAILGTPAIAISQYMRPEVPRDWVNIAATGKDVLSYLWDYAANNTNQSGDYWNINLPVQFEPKASETDPSSPNRKVMVPISHSPLEASPLVIKFEGQRSPVQPSAVPTHSATLKYVSDYHHRPRQPGSDVERCFGGHATITKLNAFKPPSFTAESC